MGNEKKSQKIRSGFFGIKLTDEALNYQIENYNQLSGLHSIRVKAGIAYIILYILGWLLFIGQNPSTSHTLGYALLIIGFVIAAIIKVLPKIGITIAFLIYLINAVFIIINNPASILGALIAFYILAYFLYPAYQVENKINIKTHDKNKGKIQENILPSHSINKQENEAGLSIKKLQTKIWYRFIKVLFILAIIFTLFIGIGIFIDKKTREINYEKSTITCNSGNKKSLNDKVILEKFADLNTVNLRFRDNSDLAKAIKTDVQKLCEISKEGMNNDLDKLAKVNFAKNNFGDFRQKDWLSVIGIILMILFFEETIRRTFYYIVLGNFFPNKN